MQNLHHAIVSQRPLKQTLKYYPVYSGILISTDTDRLEREEIIWYALKTYSFLLEKNRLYRLCYLAEKIRKFYDCESNLRNKLVADLLIVNSFYYCPFYIKHNGQVIFFETKTTK